MAHQAADAVCLANDFDGTDAWLSRLAALEAVELVREAAALAGGALSLEKGNEVASMDENGAAVREPIFAVPHHARAAELKQQELQDLGNRIDDFRQSAQESIQKKKEELYGPILKRAEDAIKDVAKEKGYAYIFDTSSGSFLYAQESDDITSLVKTKLAIK